MLLSRVTPLRNCTVEAESGESDRWKFDILKTSDHVPKIITKCIFNFRYFDECNSICPDV